MIAESLLQTTRYVYTKISLIKKQVLSIRVFSGVKTTQLQWWIPHGHLTPIDDLVGELDHVIDTPYFSA